MNWCQRGQRKLFTTILWSHRTLEVNRPKGSMNIFMRYGHRVTCIKTMKAKVLNCGLKQLHRRQNQVLLSVDLLQLSTNQLHVGPQYYIMGIYLKAQCQKTITILNICSSLAHTIRHQPTLIVMQSLRWQLKRVSYDTQCYITSHKDHCKQHFTHQFRYSVMKTGRFYT